MRRIGRGIIYFIIWVIISGCSKSKEQQIAEQLELGQKYLTEQNYEEAIVLEPKSWEAYKGISVVYAEQGNEYEAISTMEKGIELIGVSEIPDEDIDLLAKHYMNLTEEDMLMGNLKSVLSYYERVLKLRPQSEEL